MTYEIRVKGLIESQWAEWFGDMAITYVNESETLLLGELHSQIDLQRVLERIRILGLDLVSVRRTD